MPQYLLSFYQPDGPIPAPEVLQRVMRDLDAINREIKAAGSWVFAGGLHHPSTATVARFKDGEVLLTDGPFAEGKEFLGGITIVDAPDLDAALAWATKISRATTLPIEVRPFHPRPA
jgi:hypothetical protein